MTPERRPVRWLHVLGIGRPRPDASAELEIEHHIAELTDRLVATGLDPDEARRDAERHFGDRARHAAKMRKLEAARLRGDAFGAAVEIVRQRFVSVARAARREPGGTREIGIRSALGARVRRLASYARDRHPLGAGSAQGAPAGPSSPAAREWA